MEKCLLKLSEEELQEISWGDDDRFELIKDGDWINEYKYQNKTFIFKDIATGKLYEGWICRTGSPWEGYDIADCGFQEVIKVTKLVEVTTYEPF